MKKKNTPALKKKPVNTSDELNILTNEKTVAATKKQGAFFFFPFTVFFIGKKKVGGAAFRSKHPLTWVNLYFSLLLLPGLRLLDGTNPDRFCFCFCIFAFN